MTRAFDNIFYKKFPVTSFVSVTTSNYKYKIVYAGKMLHTIICFIYNASPLFCKQLPSICRKIICNHLTDQRYASHK